MMFDVVVIGGGSGGYAAAVRCADLGATVCVVEKEVLGGTGLNWGCIPTKTLHRNAEVANLVKNVDDYGIMIKAYEIDIAKIQERKHRIIDQLKHDIENTLFEKKVKVVNGEGRVISRHEVMVGLSDGREKLIKCKHVILATGSQPIIPDMEGADLEGVLSSRELLEFGEAPDHLVIVGAGVIGLEFASIFEALGSRITLVSSSDRILARVDREVSLKLEAHLKRNDVNLVYNARVYAVTADEEESYAVLAKQGDATIKIEGDKVLIAIGRKPNVSGLGLDETQIEFTRRGVAVDENYMTNVEGVYAVGDINGKMMLAYTAVYQGNVAADHIMKGVSSSKIDALPACIFAFPEIACVGLTEEEADQDGIDYKVSKFSFELSAKALALGETEGMVKVISDHSNQILGVHIIGPHATDLIHEGVLAIHGHMSAKDIITTIHAYPTLAEVFAKAVNGLVGKD